MQGELLEFVFPKEFVGRTWKDLSTNYGGERIFHVNRAGPNYELADKVEPQLRLITRFLQMYESIE